ncbi:glycosyltransferase 87 family protein [Paenibacillus pabuli]|uniref:glycosyltransferase 87 family protein n=1 Tax=Paenibacillus pabuli TaxID=1472 RepID=UPI003457543A
MELFKRDKSVNRLTVFNMWDIIVFSVVLIISFFTFQHADILHTGGSSFTFLDGHIRDFYDENAKRFGFTNYLPSTYILFAIWNLPLKLFGVVEAPHLHSVGNAIFWYKLLPSLFYAASAVVICKIGQTFGLSKRNSIIMSFFWVTTPMAFFSQFIFGQYDILTLFFTLLGVLYFLKKNQKLFILFFAIAMTFKYFPLFIFIPLLLLSEKRLPKLIIKFICFLAPIGLEVLFYWTSREFHQGVFGFNANQRLFTAGFKIEGDITISFFIITWALFCALAYCKKIENDEEYKNWSLYISMVTSSLIFAFILYHPQWVLFATPFLAITTFLHKRFNFFVVLDLLAMYFFVGYTVNAFPGNVDQALFGLGVFSSINPILAVPNSSVFMRDFFVPHDLTIFYSFMTAYFFTNIIFKFPSNKIESLSLNNFSINRESWILIRMRFIIGILIFIVPATVSYLSPNYGNELINIEKVHGNAMTPIGEILKDNTIGQVFHIDSNKIKKIQLKMATFARENSSTIKFEIHEYNNKKVGKTIFSKEINSNLIKDNDYENITFGNGLEVKANQKYIFEITSLDAQTGNAVTIYRTNESRSDDNFYAIINNVEQQYNLVFNIYGE